MNTVVEVVAQKLKENGIVLASEKAVDTLVGRIVDKRADALVKVIDLIDQEDKALKKIDRPDQVTYTKDRKISSEVFSKARLDEIDKITKRKTKLEACVNKALEKDDWSDIFNAASGKLKDEPEAASSGDSTES